MPLDLRDIPIINDQAREVAANILRNNVIAVYGLGLPRYTAC